MDRLLDLLVELLGLFLAIPLTCFLFFAEGYNGLLVRIRYRRYLMERFPTARVERGTYRGVRGCWVFDGKEERFYSDEKILWDYRRGNRSVW